MDPIVWIIIGVVAVIVVVALIALAARNNNRKKLTAASELRKDAREREQQLERQHSVAREQEHRAGAAEQEAKAKAAEAERLRVEADQHRSAVDEQRQDVRRMEQHAEKLDPKHRADGLDHDGDRGVLPGNRGRDTGGGPGTDQGRRSGGAGVRGAGAEPGIEHGSGNEHGSGIGTEPGSGRGPGAGPGGVAGVGEGDAGGRHARTDGLPGSDAHGVTGHNAGPRGDSVDPAVHQDEDPGIVDKMLGRTHRDERRP